MISDKLSGPLEASFQARERASAGLLASMTDSGHHTARSIMGPEDQSCMRLARRRNLHIQKIERRGQHLDKQISLRCKSILAARSVPFLFILVCFLIIANTRCDQAGGANGEPSTSEGGSSSSSSSSSNANIDTTSVDKLKASDLASLSAKDLEALEQQTVAAKNQQHHKSTARKMDPLNILREIYLDSNSKIITMLMPESETENGLTVVTVNPLLITYDTFKRHNIVTKSTVQKFHPNGRYGRRSVDNFAEPHVELGRLVYNEDLKSLSEEAPLSSGAESSALRAILKNIGRSGSSADSRLSAVATAHARSAPTKYKASRPLVFNSDQVADYQFEMNKLLRCNFTGISNLYWCDAAGSK